MEIPIPGRMVRTTVLSLNWNPYTCKDGSHNCLIFIMEIPIPARMVLTTVLSSSWKSLYLEGWFSQLSYLYNGNPYTGKDGSHNCLIFIMEQPYAWKDGSHNCLIFIMEKPYALKYGSHNCLISIMNTWNASHNCLIFIMEIPIPGRMVITTVLSLSWKSLYREGWFSQLSYLYNGKTLCLEGWFSQLSISIMNTWNGSHNCLIFIMEIPIPGRMVITTVLSLSWKSLYLEGWFSQLSWSL